MSGNATNHDLTSVNEDEQRYGTVRLSRHSGVNSPQRFKPEVAVRLFPFAINVVCRGHMVPTWHQNCFSSFLEP
jgi:hypothetical protein